MSVPELWERILCEFEYAPPLQEALHSDSPTNPDKGRRSIPYRAHQTSARIVYDTTIISRKHTHQTSVESVRLIPPMQEDRAQRAPGGPGGLIKSYITTTLWQPAP